MTSRERIRAALAHREPDRLPIDCGAMRATGIQAIAYHRLKAHLGLTEGPTRVFDVGQQLAEPETAFLDRFGIDAINAGRAFPPNQWQDWTLPDGEACQIPAWVRLQRRGDEWVTLDAHGGVISRMVQGAIYFSANNWPLADDAWLTALDDLDRHLGPRCARPLPEPLYQNGLSDENLERIAGHVKRLSQSSDRAIMIASGASLFARAAQLRRPDNFLLDLAAEPEQVEKLLDKLVEIHLADLSRLLPALGDHVDLIEISDDLGMETGPFFSPKVFRDLFKPRYRVIVDHIKKTNPHLKVFLHCCGSIRPLIADLIDIGFDVLNPVQISANDMAPATLKREFGSDITFWGGGCDTQHVLARATPQEVRDHVRRNIDIFAPGGGYVFTPVHNIQADVPPENILAMFEAARESS